MTLAATTCQLCGAEVTAKDPEVYPYCRNCHYTGQAHGHRWKATLDKLGAAFPGASVGIDHTGGGCFWLAVRWPDDPKYYVLTDGEAALPETEEGFPLADSWGYVGRQDDTDEAGEENDDYEGSPLFWDYEKVQTDAEVIDTIRADREARGKETHA